MTAMVGELDRDLAATSLALARRFEAGATMWCASPAWPAHAHHVAVEFVHPVIVGKRALPAVCLEGPDVVAELRAVTRPGDVVLAIATADEAAIAGAMRRAPAWGVETVWLGFGPRPPAGAADHVLWYDDADPLTAHRGRFVLAYHLLWELTHVCFEHPGLLTDSGEVCSEADVCITCSDEGRLAEVVTAGAGGSAVVRTAAGNEQADVTLVGPVAAGDLVLVHAGSVLSVVEGTSA